MLTQHSTTERGIDMHSNDILFGIMLGSAIPYLVGVGIGIHAFLKFYLLGDPRKATGAALQEHHGRLVRAIKFRWLSMVFLAVAVVLNMLFRTDGQFTLAQYWQVAIALVIAEFVGIPILKHAKKIVWAVWVLRRGAEQGICPKR